MRVLPRDTAVSNCTQVSFWLGLSLEENLLLPSLLFFLLSDLEADFLWSDLI